MQVNAGIKRDDSVDGTSVSPVGYFGPAQHLEQYCNMMEREASNGMNLVNKYYEMIQKGFVL